LWERICRYCKVGWKRYGNLSGEKVCYGVIVLCEEVTDDDGKREVVLGVQVGQLRKSLFQLAVDVAENNAVTNLSVHISIKVQAESVYSRGAGRRIKEITDIFEAIVELAQ
jgi:hypothetical protein